MLSFKVLEYYGGGGGENIMGGKTKQKTKKKKPRENVCSIDNLIIESS